MTDRITMERTFTASLGDVWDLWTTKAGIESWWGPDGFAVTVKKLELHPGGELLYVMEAIDADTIAFMKRAGMPVATDARIVFREVVPQRRIAYTHDVDFVPGLPTYGINYEVDFAETTVGTLMTLRFDRMHDQTWSERQAQGWTMELAKLAKLATKTISSAG